MLDTLGSRIRKLREMKNLTREEICHDETELSIRHLARIEKGESIPGIGTLSYIASALDVKVEVLLNLSNLYEYCLLKNQLELFSIDYNAEKNMEIDQSLERIYERYYDDLPEEEQMYIDCSATSHEVRQIFDPEIAEVTLNKYKYVLTSKKAYSSNELAYISLYTWIICLSESEMLLPKRLLEIHTYLETEDDLSIQLSIRVQINIASYLYYKEEYQEALDLLNLVQKRATEKKAFQRLPIIHMLKGKCLNELNQKEQADEAYQDAIQLAQMLHLEGLVLNIEKEYEADFNTINKHK